ncbi:MAG TPA: hypothetical protein VNP04_29575 [Alphaproteobacteria bacterium]|nr:hypothetical protein [Alphaproteobacteria bacterium]
MAWTLYRITWRLESPLHSGFAKLGNIQRTRLYITGRMLWGALTSRLTREQGSHDYVRVGEAVNEYIALGYAYLSLTADGSQPLLPHYTATGLKFAVKDDMWTEREVQQFCLASYASTALNYQRNAAEEGSLHEVEFISPRTLCALNGISAGAPLYLTTYLAVSDTIATMPEVQGWQAALPKLQLGGERTYGFGRMSLVHEPTPSDNKWWGHSVVLSRTRPEVSIDAGNSLLAHANASLLLPSDVKHGALEPLLGRDTTPQSAFGKDLQALGICWLPGTTVERPIRCQIMPMGLWRKP